MFESSSLTRLLGENKEVHFDEIKSGCCGMAGMFGYEKTIMKFHSKLENSVCFQELEIQNLIAISLHKDLVADIRSSILQAERQNTGWNWWSDS